MKLKPSKTINALAFSAFTMAGSHAATLIAGFDFQTTTTGGTAAAASSAGNPSPLVYHANFGSATLYLNGANGSSTFTTGVTNPQVTSFGGTDVNTAGTTFSTGTSGAASLAVANSSANGSRMVFVLSMRNLEGLDISYATQATNTGFSLQTWSYSTDGSTFTDFATFAPGGGSGATVSFATNGVVDLNTSALTVLDGEDDIYIGLTFSGASNTSGNNRLDNIQFTAVPEPSAALLGGLGMFALLRRRRLG